VRDAKDSDPRSQGEKCAPSNRANRIDHRKGETSPRCGLRSEQRVMGRKRGADKKPRRKRQRKWEGMLEVEGGRANIYGLGKRRWAVPARFARSEGVPNSAWQTPESKLHQQFIQCLHDTEQEKNKNFHIIIFYLFIMYIFLSCIFSYLMNDNHQAENTVSTLQSWMQWSSWSKIRTLLYKISSIWRAEQSWWIAKKQHRHAVKVYLSTTCWIEAIYS